MSGPEGSSLKLISKCGVVFIFIEKEELFILEALKEARKAEAKDEVPVGCVLVENDKIIARAHNLRETKKRAIAHAEILAIEKACKKKKAWYYQ